MRPWSVKSLSNIGTGEVKSKNGQTRRYFQYSNVVRPVFPSVFLRYGDVSGKEAGAVDFSVTGDVDTVPTGTGR